MVLEVTLLKIFDQQFQPTEQNEMTTDENILSKIQKIKQKNCIEIIPQPI